MIPFEAVVAAHGATVLRVTRAVCGPDDADDAWSEAFLAALRAYPELPVDANLEAWLVTIARRKAVDVLRARARRAVPLDPLSDPGAADPGAADPDIALVLDLSAAVAGLAPKQRRCVELHHLGGLPYDEIAALVGGTAAAARRAAADGIATLRRTHPDLETLR